MQKNRILIRMLVMIVAILLALLLLAGMYVALASQAPTPEHDLNSLSASVSATSWSSGWVPITQGQIITFAHNLGGDPDTYAVELDFRDLDPGGLGLHHRGYGGVQTDTLGYGAHWQRLKNTSVQVFRGPDDLWVDRVRIRVWIPSTIPDYDSGWTSIATDTCRVFTHSLGITPTELTVGLWFKDTRIPNGIGINHFAYGGLQVDGNEFGAHWQELTENTVRVCRHRDDETAGQVRVIVAHGASPDWDSGWSAVVTGTTVLSHNLNWNPEMMLVRAECRQSGGRGIHQMYGGGYCSGSVCEGANWENLTYNTITVNRWPNDTVCPEVRIRIWQQIATVYLPLILKNTTSP